MKSVVADYRYRSHCLRIETSGGLIVRLTDHPRDLTMGNGQVYRTDSGYQFTGQQSTTSMSPGVMDIEGIANVAGVGRDELSSGVFDGARLYVFATTWKTPIDDEEPVGAAILGKATLLDGRYRIEMMALIDALNQSVGKTFTAACQKTFGGQEYAGCKVALGPLTVTGTLTAVTSSSIVTDSARSEVSDYFGAGTIQFTSGANAGLKPMEIKSYASGVIEVFEAFHYLPSVGDAYTMIPGCRQRQTDCINKWNNIVNFGGFSNVPTSSQYGQIGQQ